MALTATAQSALPREPTWDEAIVPALRKRLKDESSALAKRISAASITSGEDQPGQYHAAALPGSSASSHSQSKPSAIPRPSFQSTRTTDSSSAGAHAGTRPAVSSSPRARALSQPYPFEPPPPADPPSVPDSSRPISPVNAPKGTRIPVSRNRTGSMSSQTQPTHHGSTGRATGSSSSYPRHTAEASASDAQLWPVEETKMHSQTSRSTVRLPRNNVSDIFQEQAPFAPTSFSSSQSPYSHLDYGRQTPERERVSSDSEERPFEHWYRGDVARNGGVGELRVARRQEMLDIANYGHTLRKASGKHTTPSSRSRSNSRSREMANGRARTRTRADSVGARESIYIDPEENGDAAVMDERPLTDLEDDGYEDHVEDYYAQAVQPHPNGSISSPSLDRSDTPTSRTTANTTRSRIPQPTRSRTTTPTPAPAKPTRSASESGMAGPSSSPSASTKVPRSASQPKSPAAGTAPSTSTPSTPTTSKRRAKSPANAAAGSASKKPKGPPSSMQKRAGGAKDEEKRRSIGQYPMAEGDEDAIPTWTQPVPVNGNWDDVVLPVVARKKGLQDHFEIADGSPKPKEPEPVVVEPAPGTFGYDPSKYRKRYSANPEQIPMGEFGQKPDSPVQELSVPPPEERMASPAISGPPRTPNSFNRMESPPPFAHYAQAEELSPPPPHLHMQTMQPMATLSPMHKQEYQQPMAEDDARGCCKCVIM